MGGPLIGEATRNALRTVVGRMDTLKKMNLQAAERTERLLTAWLRSRQRAQLRVILMRWHLTAWDAKVQASKFKADEAERKIGVVVDYSKQTVEKLRERAEEEKERLKGYEASVERAMGLIEEERLKLEAAEREVREARAEADAGRKRAEETEVTMRAWENTVMASAIKAQDVERKIGVVVDYSKKTIEKLRERAEGGTERLKGFEASVERAMGLIEQESLKLEAAEQAAREARAEADAERKRAEEAEAKVRMQVTKTGRGREVAGGGERTRRRRRDRQ